MPWSSMAKQTEQLDEADQNFSRKKKRRQESAHMSVKIKKKKKALSQPVASCAGRRGQFPAGSRVESTLAFISSPFPFSFSSFFFFFTQIQLYPPPPLIQTPFQPWSPFKSKVTYSHSCLCAGHNLIARSDRDRDHRVRDCALTSTTPSCSPTRDKDARDAPSEVGQSTA